MHAGAERCAPGPWGARRVREARAGSAWRPPGTAHVGATFRAVRRIPRTIHRCQPEAWPPTAVARIPPITALLLRSAPSAPPARASSHRPRTSAGHHPRTGRMHRMTPGLRRTRTPRNRRSPARSASRRDPTDRGSDEFGPGPRRVGAAPKGRPRRRESPPPARATSALAWAPAGIRPTLGSRVRRRTVGGPQHLGGHRYGTERRTEAHRLTLGRR